MSKGVKYIRFSILVGVPEDIEDEAVETDLRDLINGDLDWEGTVSIPYDIVVSDIEIEDK